MIAAGEVKAGVTYEALNPKCKGDTECSALLNNLVVCNSLDNCSAEQAKAIDIFKDDKVDDVIKLLKGLEEGKAKSSSPAEKTDAAVSEPAVEEDKKEPAAESGRIAAGFVSLFGGGNPGGLSALSLLDNTSADDYCKSTGACGGEGTTTELNGSWGLEIGALLTYPPRKGFCFQGQASAVFRHIITSNPTDPGQSRTAIPADIFSLGIAIAAQLAYDGDSVRIAAGPRIEALGTFLAGGDHGEIKTGYQGLIDNGDFAHFDFRLGAEASVLYKASDRFWFGPFVSYTAGLTPARPDRLNASEGSVQDKIGVPHVVSGGAQVRF